jgi:UPF0176 protein
MSDMPVPMSEAALVHSAFYQFTDLPDPAGVAAGLRRLAQGVTGSIVVAREGLNGAVAGPRVAVAAFEQAVREGFDGAFARMAFKRSGCITPPFGRLKVQVRREIVALNLPGGGGPGAVGRPGVQVAPAQWRTLLDRDDVVVLDNRNHFEYRLGHFRRALDPGVGNFRDFPAFVEAQAARWRQEGLRVAMYCTGGIRCEKTAAWMSERFGLDVLQLEGGILHYFEQMPDADRDWQGECFVFDRRIALDTRLQETATTVDQVYGDGPDEAWRRERARRLDQA